jgi:sucrose-phosphate synthase
VVLGMSRLKKSRSPLYIMHVSVHGLIRTADPQIGFDADTGGQVTYVLDLVRALAGHHRVRRVELITRKIMCPRVAVDYAIDHEPIGDGASLRRFACGPDDYLRKELLWPHLPEFVDNILRFIRAENDIPDVIHAHYADAGLVATRIAKVLGIPLIFTAHSLGRYKQERLFAAGLKPARAEKTYHFRDRIEAEEETLENAALVIASSRDEIERRYRVYDRYNRFAMQVIPPGCDLERFAKPVAPDAAKQLRDSIAPFLRDLRKPALTVIARPDPQKNVPAALRIFAEAGLRDRVNLLLFIGQRQSSGELDADSLKLFTELLWLIDEHDLYGRVAYPKTHTADIIAAAYQHTVRSGGAMLALSKHENFGLTLVEAAAAGAPVVSSGAGGMADILDTCGHGIIVDPEDSAAAAARIIGLLGDRKQWLSLSGAGRRAAPRHYTWAAHVESYLVHIDKVLAFRGKQLPKSHRPRRFASARYILLSDIDGTLTGSRRGVERLNRLIARNDRLLFGVATGRGLDGAMETLQSWGVAEPQILITSVGTSIHYNVERPIADSYWPGHIRFRWRPARVRELLDSWPGLKPQEEAAQGPFKVSYYCELGAPPDTDAITRHFRRHNVQARVVCSKGEGDLQCLDVLPVRASKGLAMRYLAWRLGFDLENIVAAGDAGNDLDMLLGSTKAIVVANHSRELDGLRNEPGIFFSPRRHAWGIIDGLNHYSLAA